MGSVFNIDVFRGGVQALLNMGACAGAQTGGKMTNQKSAQTLRQKRKARLNRAKRPDRAKRANPRKGANLELLDKLPSAERAALGGKLRSHAKRARPLAPRASLHVMLKSSKARGRLSFLHKNNEFAIHRIIKNQARKFFVRIDTYANVGNHLHLKVYAQAPEEFRQFLRSITCLIARHVTGARRGRRFGPFWDSLAFTRILRTFTEHQILDRYIFANRLEGWFGRQVRDSYLSGWYGHLLDSSA